MLGPLSGLRMAMVLEATDDVAIVMMSASVQVYGFVDESAFGYQYTGMIRPG